VRFSFERFFLLSCKYKAPEEYYQGLKIKIIYNDNSTEAETLVKKKSYLPSGKSITNNEVNFTPYCAFLSLFKF
jgi:hypothetical protein